MSLITQIKEKISLRECARMLGIYGLPERDDVKFHSPLRVDHTASCSIWKERLIDWSRDERLDAIDLYAVVKGVPQRTALHELARLVGVGEEPGERRLEGGWPRFTEGTKAEAQALCDLRGFTMEGLRLARDRGLLRFTHVCREPCWVITDGEKLLAQARRLDGRLFPIYSAKDGGRLEERKSHTLKGSKQGHVVGTCNLGRYRYVMLVEGGPDVLAAHCFIAESGGEACDYIGVLGILGASNALPASVAKACLGKHVRVFGHTDRAGKEAASRWRMVLHAKGVNNDAFKFRPHGDLAIKDLNDLLIHGDHPDRGWVTRFDINSERRRKSDTN